uniref:Uncharacterized protein n=1 Tax=Oryza meridionalis TaxID=40149 RepID=A0A0E0FCS7_9ORYZ
MGSSRGMCGVQQSTPQPVTAGVDSVTMVGNLSIEEAFVERLASKNQSEGGRLKDMKRKKPHNLSTEEPFVERLAGKNLSGGQYMSLSGRETTDELTWGQRSCVFQFYTVEFTPSLLYEISSPLIR